MNEKSFWFHCMNGQTCEIVESLCPKVCKHFVGLAGGLRGYAFCKASYRAGKGDTAPIFHLFICVENDRVLSVSTDKTVTVKNLLIFYVLFLWNGNGFNNDDDDDGVIFELWRWSPCAVYHFERFSLSQKLNHLSFWTEITHFWASRRH